MSSGVRLVDEVFFRELAGKGGAGTWNSPDVLTLDEFKSTLAPLVEWSLAAGDVLDLLFALVVCLPLTAGAEGVVNMVDGVVVADE